MTYDNPITSKLVSTLYKDEEQKPIELSPGQLEIFDLIAGRLYPRAWLGTVTQYGKSFTVGLAVLTRASHYPEKWTIIAPKDKQAQIIMGYIIDHIFDNELIFKKFEVDKSESVDRIRRERSRNRVTFKQSDGSIGGVQVLSAQGQKKKNILDAVMGFGSPNIILDESSLLSDEHFAGVIRMLGGQKDTCLIQIGNPFYRNHFYKASINPRYHKVRIDYRQAVAEGRMSQEFIDEVREEMSPQNFRVLYDVKFPDEDAQDAQGYTPMITGTDLERAEITEVELVGELYMGIDVAGGGRNKTAVTVRGSNAAKLVYKTSEKDHMVIGPRIIHYVKKYKVKPENIRIDRVGIGHGLWNFLQQELGREVDGIAAGEPAEPDPDLKDLDFADLRSQMYWRACAWINKGAKLKADAGWDEAENAGKWKVTGEKKIQFITKKELREQGIESPDCFDSLALTFARKPKPSTKEYKQKPYTGTAYEGGDTVRENTSGRITSSDRGFNRYGLKG